MKVNKKIILLMSTILPTIALGDVLSEMQRFQKCYGIFVGERVPLKDARWLKVKAGTLSGTDACMEIFDSANLTSNGEIRKTNGEYNPIGMKVLSNFMKFHKSQLQVPDYGKVIGLAADRYTRDVTDTNEAVYHFLYSTFGTNQKYSDVITRPYSLFAKRASVAPSRIKTIINSTTNLPAFQQGTFKTIQDANMINQTVPDEANGGVMDFSPVLVETGLLYGITEDRRENTYTLNRTVSSFGFTSTNVNQHLGGGAIGTQAYLLANLGKDGFNNGGTGLYRRWGKHVMEDFLCRSLPALRTTDVMDEVDISSNIAFRTGSSCMACHSSMDMLAGAARNVRTGWTHNTGQITTRIKYVGSRNPTLAEAAFPTKSNEGNFYQRPANGRLYYRSYDGSIVKVDDSIVGFSDLGEAMAETNDLYVCAAKRYYKFLTGIDVDLADIGDMNTPQFSKGQLKQRNKVIDLGMKLKSHQSVRSLLKTIIESQTFIQPDKGV